MMYEMRKQCSFCMATAEYVLFEKINVCAYHCHLMKEGKLE